MVRRESSVLRADYSMVETISGSLAKIKNLGYCDGKVSLRDYCD